MVCAFATPMDIIHGDILATGRVTGFGMEIAIIVILFLIGSIGGAMQALKYIERRRKSQDRDRGSDDRPSRHP